jgi:fluoroacetyl-CoA thioesterase
MEAGTRAEMTIMVEREDTAARVGSGDMLLLATPTLLAFAETVTVRALPLPEGQSSVATRVALEHLAASPVGMHVTVTAEVREVDGPRVVFDVDATDKHGTVVARGTIERTVVDRATYLSTAGKAPQR